jgi:S-adenosylmethionine:tRNA ribosyltransferase-isomerase
VRDLRADDLDFPLPAELIARHPAVRRSAARMLVARGDVLEHARAADLPRLLEPGDLLVLNETRVLPARLLLRKETGGVAEGLWLSEQPGGGARAQLSGGRLRPGLRLLAGKDGSLMLGAKLAPGLWEIRMGEPAAPTWEEWLARHGATPLPPYVRRLREQDGEPEERADDRERYQTVWARVPGSVAAPTASLHLDEAMLAEIGARGVTIGRLSLHVGQGTFLPVTAPTLAEHRMHEESFIIPPELEAAVADCRQRGGRVIAAGTTACRALEAWARGERGATRLLIAPGHEWRAVDALLTNFHTPRSTLLALVAAFAERCGAPDGLAFVKAAYAEAVARRYRFFSFGDASFWLPSSR